MIKTILILAANPSDKTELSVYAELKALRNLLQPRFNVELSLQTGWDDFNEELLRCNPDIVHFVGHGKSQDGLILEDVGGNGAGVTGDRLSALFSLFPQVECVVMNACWTERVAVEIHRHVRCVIGMSQSIADQSAREFALGFYQGLLEKKGYEWAFKYGKGRISGASGRMQPSLFIRDEVVAIVDWENPGRKMLLTSPFYIARSNLEDGIYGQLMEPGGLVRIKAPREFGKSSLMSRVVAKLEGAGAKTVSIDFREIEPRYLQDLDGFLKWFCRQITRSLDLRIKVGEVWDEDGGSDACRDYFEDHVLPMISEMLVLELDDVDELLSESIGEWKIQFFKMLRAWFERGRSDKRWGKLRMVLVHSREIGKETIVAANSPFNVGDETRLPAFTSDQVEELVNRHSLRPIEPIVERLMELVSGYPYLVRRALYEMGSQKVSMDQVLVDVTTRSGIYGNHLQKLQSHLEQTPQLRSAMRLVLASGTEGAVLDEGFGTTLQDLGLVRFQGDRLQVTCELYRVYFSRCWT